MEKTYIKPCIKCIVVKKENFLMSTSPSTSVYDKEGDSGFQGAKQHFDSFNDDSFNDIEDAENNRSLWDE